MKPVVIGGVVVAVAALVIVVVASGNDEKALMEQKVMEEKVMEQEKMEAEAMMKKDDAMMAKDEAVMEGDEVMMKKDDTAMTKGSYSVYSADKLSMANNGKVVLFFKASWCPSCRALDADIKANLGSIPDGVAILEVDYDSAADLKQKYGVTMQHTLVQVDASGNLINKWSGGGTLAAVAANIK